jgi:hypothetical protein
MVVQTLLRCEMQQHVTAANSTNCVRLLQCDEMKFVVFATEYLFISLSIIILLLQVVLQLFNKISY